MSRVLDTFNSKAQEVAKEDYGRAKVLMKDAAASRSYLYPIKGIGYFMTHSALWKPFLSRLGPTMSLALGVFGSMFFVTYLPQLAVMMFVNGPLAVVTTVILILNESSTITSIISRNFMMQEALLDTFDGTLIARNKTAIVAEGRQVKAGGDPMQRLGKVFKKPFERFGMKSLVRYIMYLPVNFIPVVGTVMFIVLQGRSRGVGVHDRYFQLKKWSPSQRKAWIDEHAGGYAAFGTVATLLEMVPFASILFSFTNTVGAALWAADIEAKQAAMTNVDDAAEAGPSQHEATPKAD